MLQSLRGDSSRTAEVVQPQLTRNVDGAPAGDDWLHEIRYDGYRGTIQPLTRASLNLVASLSDKPSKPSAFCQQRGLILMATPLCQSKCKQNVATVRARKALGWCSQTLENCRAGLPRPRRRR
jgi:hypothetical protein